MIGHDSALLRLYWAGDNLGVIVQMKTVYLRCCLYLFVRVLCNVTSKIN